MYYGMCMGIAFEAERREDSVGDRPFRDSAPGNADLDDGTSQKKERRTGVPDLSYPLV
jgi:hypothetical protein